MPEYRRAFVPGGTFFFTVVSERRFPLFGSAPARSFLREAFAATSARWPFAIDAIVVLPDHLHTIWTLPDNDHDFSTRWSFLKRTFTKAWIKQGGCEQALSASRVRNRRRGVWQRRFWEHAIRNETDFARHCDYIHYNPVKHGVASCPHSWAFSSFRQFVADRIYDEDWLCSCSRRQVKAPDFSRIAETAVE
ncbi:MAG: transposase [Phycisphaerae bacterium]